MLRAKDDRDTDDPRADEGCLVEALRGSYSCSVGPANADDDLVDGAVDALLPWVADLAVLLRRCEDGVLFPLGFRYHLRAIVWI